MCNAMPQRLICINLWTFEPLNLWTFEPPGNPDQGAWICSQTRIWLTSNCCGKRITAYLLNKTFLAKLDQFKHILVWFEAYLCPNFRDLGTRWALVVTDIRTDRQINNYCNPRAHAHRGLKIPSLPSTGNIHMYHLFGADLPQLIRLQSHQH